MVDTVPAVASRFRLITPDELPLRPPADFVAHVHEPLPAGSEPSP